MKQRILILSLGILFFNTAFGQNQKTTETGLNINLVTILDTIHLEDQKYRIELQELEKKYSWESKEVQDLWKIIDIKDSINLIKVEKILNEKGWLGPDIVGEKGSLTLFLVVQHSNTKTQVKYLPMLREAVKNGNAKAKNLALMEDRVLLAQGEKQIYGSQLEQGDNSIKWKLSPMIDPDNVDKRRADVGLEPLAEYLQFWNLPWDVEKFKKGMEEYDLQKDKK